MDIKSLYDCANENEIGFQHDDGYHDAVEPWIQLLINTPEYMADVWIDFLVEELKPDSDDFKELMLHLSRAQGSFAAISQKGSHIPQSLSSTVIWGSCITHDHGMMAKNIHKALMAGATKYVTKHAEEWWADCVSYAGDMEEGARDDHEYDAMVERKLDERA